MEPLCRILGITVNELLAGESIPILKLVSLIDMSRLELVKQWNLNNCECAYTNSMALIKGKQFFLLGSCAWHNYISFFEFFIIC